jgi:hypothetical protein
VTDFPVNALWIIRALLLSADLLDCFILVCSGCRTAVPFNNSSVRQALSRRFGVRGIPTYVLSSHICPALLRFFPHKSHCSHPPFPIFQSCRLIVLDGNTGEIKDSNARGQVASARGKLKEVFDRWANAEPRPLPEGSSMSVCTIA